MDNFFEYTELYPLNKSGTVVLIKNNSTGQLFVRKTLQIYDIYVYEYLSTHRPSGIPIIHSFRQTDEGLVVIEEYINGQNLKTAIEERGPMDPQLALKFLTEICKILAPLHQNNPPIVHRDIKPSNILVTDTYGVYLLDFNAATKYSKDKDQDTVLIGTTGYAAPEQYGFKASDPRADVYALGRVAQDLLTGEKSSPENYNGPFANIIKKCLELDPKQRYRDASQLASAFLDGSRESNKKDNIRFSEYKDSEGAPAYFSVRQEYKTESFYERKFAKWKLLLMIPFFIFLLFGLWGHVEENGMSSLPSAIVAVIYYLLQLALLINLGGIHSKMPITNSEKILVRILGLIIYSIVLLVGMAPIVSILDPR